MGDEVYSRQLHMKQFLIQQTVEYFSINERLVSLQKALREVFFNMSIVICGYNLRHFGMKWRMHFVLDVVLAVVVLMKGGFLRSCSCERFCNRKDLKYTGVSLFTNL